MITKEQALSRMTQEEEAEFDLWEKKFDSALSTFSGSTSIGVRDLTYRVRMQLIKHYQKNGWTVTYSDDQRDGPFLFFT